MQTVITVSGFMFLLKPAERVNAHEQNRTDDDGEGQVGHVAFLRLGDGALYHGSLLSATFFLGSHQKAKNKPNRSGNHEKSLESVHPLFLRRWFTAYISRRRVCPPFFCKPYGFFLFAYPGEPLLLLHLE